MGLKIFHTGDVHIGMKFGGYPDGIRDGLCEARLNVLKKLVDTANKENCSIFAVAGDLFDSVSVANSIITKTIDILNGFTGECILILPGNHDYYDGVNDIWSKFNKAIGEKLILLNENRVYNLDVYGIKADIYPAFCNKKHSDKNNLDWIKKTDIKDRTRINIGIAHGAIEGLSLDMENTYFNMKIDELRSIPVDLWLLGHTHVRYPNNDEVSDEVIFNAGTPEPDGLNYKGWGNAWIINIDDNGNIKSSGVKSGCFRFYDLEYNISDLNDIEDLKKELIDDESKNKIVRLTLKGSLDEDIFEKRREYYREIEDKLYYFICDESELGIRVTRETIEREFTQGSFPQKFLNGLLEDREALQIAYDMIRRVKK